LPRLQQSVQKHLAQALVDVELVGVAGIGRRLLVVGLCRLDHPEDGVGPAGPVALRYFGKIVGEAVRILNTSATREENCSSDKKM